MAPTPPVHFATSHGARLGYQVFGQGDETIVAIPPFAQNIEIGWEQPALRAMLERFGSFCRFLHFDKRGTGTSDRTSRAPGVDERVDDLRAIMDHAGIEHAHLFAQSEGGPMTLLFAASFPERVDSVILFGSGASMAPSDLTPEQRPQYLERQSTIAAVWGTEQSPIVDRFAPSLAHDQEFRTWHQRNERMSATPESLRELLELSLDMDVSEVLPNISVPTLVLHRTGDVVVPVERGREVAQAVPGARIVEFEGVDHFGYVGDIDGWMSELEQFVTGTVQPRQSPPAPSPNIAIRTLGRFAVERDGAEVPANEWGSRHARQLLKRLVAGNGWPVTRDELTDLLWPEATEVDRLSARLSVQLSTVRRVLGGGIVSDRQSVRLDLTEVTTDLAEFHATTDDEATVAAYDGVFLPDDLYDDWTGQVRLESQTRFVEAALRLAQRAADSADHSRAAELAGRVVANDPYHEGAHQLVVQSLITSGQVGAARNAHEVWSRALAELDISVTPFDTLL